MFETVVTEETVDVDTLIREWQAWFDHIEPKATPDALSFARNAFRSENFGWQGCLEGHILRPDEKLIRYDLRELLYMAGFSREADLLARFTPEGRLFVFVDTGPMLQEAIEADMAEEDLIAETGPEEEFYRLYPGWGKGGIEEPRKAFSGEYRKQ